MKKTFLALLAVTLLAACQSRAVTGETVSATGGSYKNVTPKELSTMLEESQNRSVLKTPAVVET